MRSSTSGGIAFPVDRLTLAFVTDIDERREQMFPRLDQAQIERISRCGQRRRVEAGEILFDQGERNTRFFVVASGALEVVRPTETGTEELIRLHGPGEFTGEADLLLGRRSLVRGRMKQAGEVVVVERQRVRQLVADDPELSETIMRAFILRRAMLIEHEKGDVVVVGSRHSGDTLRLREFLTRNRHPYTYLDVESHPGVKALLEPFGVGVNEIPVVIHAGRTVLRNPSNKQLAEVIGLSLELDKRTVRDLVVVGAGPGGLAAAVYGASEGLHVLVLESEAPGGQAGSSSKIENYLGFPTGIPGADLAERAFAQAAKFGAEVSITHVASRLDCSRRPYAVIVDGGIEVVARAVVLACGARYRRLSLPELPRFENAGVYHAATPVEAQLCRGEEIIIVGGGNSAGQAAVFLSQRVRHVHLLVRSDGLSASMSQYLIRRIEESPNITVWTRTEILALEGGDRLERVRWRNNRTGAIEARPIRHVFLMMGADPNTHWLNGCVQLDDKGFIKTGSDLQREELANARWPLARPPHHLETSLPGVFAIGDARSGSIKRVASSVGEGAASVQLIHRVLRE
jgi:thioredoxin reductase (NADPH)